MHVVVRTYSGQGQAELSEAMEQHADDVEAVISSVPGFVSYAAMHGDDSVTTVTVCQDKAGTDASSTRAAAWVKQHVSTPVDPPTITQGDSFVQF